MGEKPYRGQNTAFARQVQNICWRISKHKGAGPFFLLLASGDPCDGVAGAALSHFPRLTFTGFTPFLLSALTMRPNEAWRG
jgi:hypothetical protein